MKRCAVISDTHNHLSKEVLKMLEGCDYILHAGDICTEDILDQLWPLGQLYAVLGNNDHALSRRLKTSQKFQIEDCVICMAHRKKDLPIISYDASVVITGHTHRYEEIFADGRLYLNPGSCGSTRHSAVNTMAILTIDGSSYHVERIVLNKGTYE